MGLCMGNMHMVAGQGDMLMQIHFLTKETVKGDRAWGVGGQKK